MTRPAFTAQIDNTVTSPPLTVLACGCRLDADGAVWYPCPSIYGTYRCASYLASTGQRTAMLARCEARIEEHVAVMRRMDARLAAEQRGLL